MKLANTGQKGRQKTSIPKDDLSEMWFEYRVEILGAFCKIAYIKARDQRGKKEKGGIKFLWQPAIINEGFVKYAFGGLKLCANIHNWTNLYFRNCFRLKLKFILY